MWVISKNYTRSDMAAYFLSHYNQEIDNLDWLWDFLSETDGIVVHFEDAKNSNLFVKKIYKVIKKAMEEGFSVVTE